MCEKNSIVDDDFVDFRNNLSNFVSKIFNIFNNMENLRAEFLYHDKGQVGEIYNKKLFLSIYFPKKILIQSNNGLIKIILKTIYYQQQTILENLH